MPGLKHVLAETVLHCCHSAAPSHVFLEFLCWTLVRYAGLGLGCGGGGSDNKGVDDEFVQSHHFLILDHAGRIGLYCCLVAIYHHKAHH